jgi:ankyrin repeat protein
MATLTSLPNELLLLIFDKVYPPGDDWLCHANGPFHLPRERAEALATLAALVLTSRHISIFAGTVLYDRAAKHHASLALSWAAKRGYTGTLTKALAAGAPPDQKIRLQMTRDLWIYANETQHAAMMWDNKDPEYWPAWSNHLEDYFKGSSQDRFSSQDQSARWGREMTPTRTELDVFAPACRKPVPDPETYYGQGHGFINPLMDPAFNGPAAASEDGEIDTAPEIFETGEYLVREHTPLHLAAREGHTDIVNILLDYGASLDTPSRWLCHCKPPLGLWSRLLNEPPYRPRHERMGWPDEDWAEPEPTIWSPLHAAICSSRIETARCLVSRGTNVTNLIPTTVDHVMMEGSYGALHQAAAAGHADLVGYILDTHPELDVNQPDHLSMTPFYHAYANGRWDSTVPLLLARGANINFRFRIREDGQCLSTTPLGEACRLGRFEAAIRLIDLGADINMGLQDHTHEGTQPENEITLLHLCCMDFSNDCRPYQMSASIWRPAQTQTRSRPRIIARLVAGGIPVDAKWNPGDGHGHDITPLMVAVLHTNIPALEALLAAGADPFNRTSLGKNALMTAVETPPVPHDDGRPGPLDRFLPSYNRGFRPQRDYPHQWDTVRLLLDAGVPVDDRDLQGNTVLHVLLMDHGARYAWIKPRAERHILRLLISRGADPCLRNKAGISALQVAVEKRFLYAVQMMANRCRIDLLDAFSMKEITDIVASVSSNEGGYSTSYGPLGWSEDEANYSEDDGEDFRLDTESCHLLDAIADMDRSGRLASDATFICSQLAYLSPARPAYTSSLEFAEILCSRGLEMGSFDPDTKMTLLRAATKAGRWGMARALLREVPQCDIDAVDSDGQTLLSAVIFTPTGNPRFAMHLMEAGADVHHRVALPLVCDTPLKLALRHPAIFPIEIMLRKQPIRGNPQAIAARYLHWFVRTHTMSNAESTTTKWRASGRALHALLAAGADPAEVDETGDTPLSHLLKELVLSHGEDYRLGTLHWNYRLRTLHWIKPLSRGVDINRKNKMGLNALYYLDRLLTDTRFAQDEVFMDHMRIVQLENGDAELLWRR